MSAKAIQVRRRAVQSWNGSMSGWARQNDPIVRRCHYHEICNVAYSKAFRPLLEPWWDTIITDPPFGARVHAGARTCAAHDTEGVVDYEGWMPADVAAFVSWAAPRTRRWIVPMTSHDLIPEWEAAYASVGWYAFAPVPIVIRGMGVRRQGDGPASWGLYLMPARARSRAAMANPISNGTALWRSLPGGYAWTRSTTMAGQGRGKPVSGLLELVRDYSNPGDLVCDPFAGHGSTLIAALQSGRRALGSEIDVAAARRANKNITAALACHAAERQAA